MRFLVINLKTYSESTGKKAKKIADVCYELRSEAKKRNVEIVLCPQAFDIKEVVSSKVKCFAQHVDGFSAGAHTGFMIPENLKQVKVSGSLISHSEHFLQSSITGERVRVCREAGLVSMVCARNLGAVKKVVKFGPDFIAVEPKELIGGDVSISTANPKLISNSVSACNGIPLLVGAGVKNADDVRIGLKLGACGILVASGVVKARSCKKAIIDLLIGFE